MRDALVIENKAGQVVRTICCPGNKLIAYVNHDTGRVEVSGRISDLEEADFEYTIIAEAERKELEKKPMSLGGRGHLRLVEKVEKVASLVQLEIDDPEELKQISRWTAIVHGVLALLLIALSFIFARVQAPPPTLVTVFRQDREEPPKPKTVVMAEKKIKRPTFKAKISNRTVKPRHLVTHHAPRKPVHVRTQVSLSKVGALGALGGMNQGLKGSAGFNVNATNSSLGTGLKEIGKGGAGGLERSLHGQGLVSAPSGSGAVTGTGGYATRGKGGGRPGYGKMSMVGGSSGYFLPLEEEALVEGGLDKDQIAAVIQRHLGEVIYCYEKGLQVQPRLSGRVGVRFVINSTGVVGVAGVEQSSLKDSQVEGCILGKLRTWKFPKPYGGVNVKVSYPFMLRRVG